MGLVVSDVALNNFLTNCLGGLGLQMHLYQSNTTPVLGVSTSDFTEATFDGYGVAGLSPTPTIVMAGHVATATWPDITFTCTGSTTSNDIYGYYITDTTGNTYWGERDPAAPATIANNFDSYTVSPKLTFESKFG